MTNLLDTFIRYDNRTKDYAIYAAGQIVAYAPSYGEAEAIRTRLLAERRDEGQYASATDLDGGAA